MTLDEALERLSIERAYLTSAEHTNNPVAIALAQAHVTHWETIVRQKRLEDQGGWAP
jgi:hypothetical protein